MSARKIRPGKIVCVGRNYREHAKELGNEVPKEPLIFLKPPSSVIWDGDSIALPTVSSRVEHEGEIGIVVGKTLTRVSEGDAVLGIRAIVAVNDVTARDLQKSDSQWTRAKGFDTFCPVGPILTDEIDPWAGVQVETRVNGELKQSGNTRDFIFSIDE